MTEDNGKKKTGKKRFKRFIIKLVLIVAAVSAAAAAIARFIDKMLDKKRSIKNEDSDIKEYSGIFTNKDVHLKEFGLAGIISRSAFSAINLDLKDSTFKQDAFITLTANFSAVTITIPSGYSVSFDGLINKSAVRNDFKDSAVKEPVIYIAAKTNYSAVRIKRK